MQENKLKDGVPCCHAGCLQHIIHPCECCGRIGGKMTKPLSEMTLKEVKEICEETSQCCECIFFKGNACMFDYWCPYNWELNDYRIGG